MSQLHSLESAVDERLVDIEQIFEHENNRPGSPARSCFETICYCMLSARSELESVRRSLDSLANHQKPKALKVQSLALAEAA